MRERDGGRDRAGAPVVPRRDRALPRLDRPDSSPPTPRRRPAATPHSGSSASRRRRRAGGALGRLSAAPLPASLEAVLVRLVEALVALGRGPRSSSSPRVVPSSPPAWASASWRPGWSGGRSCGLISSCASGVSPAAVLSSGIRWALGSGSLLVGHRVLERVVPRGRPRRPQSPRWPRTGRPTTDERWPRIARMMLACADTYPLQPPAPTPIAPGADVRQRLDLHPLESASPTLRFTDAS